MANPASAALDAGVEPEARLIQCKEGADSSQSNRPSAAHTEQGPGRTPAGRVPDGTREFVATDIGEDLLASAYLMLKAEGGIDSLFYDRSPSLRQFLSWVDLPGCRYLGAFVSNVGRDAELAGLGMLWNINGPAGGVRADVHIVFREKFHQGGAAYRLTGQMVDYSFTSCGVDVLYGVTPAWNRSAQRLGRRLGFTLVGPLPKFGACHGKPGDAVLMHLTREAWEAKAWEARVV